MNAPRRRRLKRATRGLLAVALLVLSGVIYSVLIRTARLVEPSNTAGLTPQIAVLLAKQVPVQRQWQGYGTADAVDSSDVPARVTATVWRVPPGVQAGASVAQGQLLVQLDDADFRQEVQIAQQHLADLDAQIALLDVQRQTLAQQLKLEAQDVELAEDERKRVDQLVGRGAANPRDLDMAKRAVIAAQIAMVRTRQEVDTLGPRHLQLKAQHAAQESSLELAQQNLARCRITSPIDGVLQSVDVEVGENVTSGDRVGRVVNVDRIEVGLRLPAAARSGLAVGDAVQLTATNQTNLTWRASVLRVGPEDDPATRTVTAYVEVDQHPKTTFDQDDPNHNHAKRLAPGMFVAGIVTSGQTQSRWVVPRRSVQDNRLLLVDRGIIQTRPVRIDHMLAGEMPGFGLPDDQWAVLHVEPGVLREGDLIVINGSTSVRVGQAATAAQGTTP